MKQYVHIVCLDVPSPHYGGGIDMYYKIKALAEAGLSIILHYFDYKGLPLGDVKTYCAQTYSYTRHTGIKGLKWGQPYIVSSRINKELISRLNMDTHPIIIEGVHGTGILPYLTTTRNIVVRLHNNEAVYYRQLALHEKNIFKKIYYTIESRLLHSYQQRLPHSVNYACLSTTDVDSMIRSYQLPQVSFLPCFLPWQQLSCMKGIGDYALYHGNLSISENEKAVLWLVQEVMPLLDYPLIIAGKNPSAYVKNKLNGVKNGRLISDPTEEVLTSLIKKAHIHLLPSFNQTGVKLKLLHALFCGRHIVTNNAGIAGSGITTGITIAETATDYQTAIQHLQHTPFTEADIDKRTYIPELYNNTSAAKKLITWLGLHYP